MKKPPEDIGRVVHCLTEYIKGKPEGYPKKYSFE